MRLKYYLRGVGIGIVVTTIIFMISISLHRNETQPLIEAEDKKSTTVSEAEKDTQKAITEGTEIKETETAKSDMDKADADSKNAAASDSDKSNTVKTDADKSDTAKTDADKTNASRPDGAKTNTDKTDSNKPDSDKTNTAKPNQNSSDAEKPQSGQTEKVRFEIRGGEFSDTVCQKLKEAGLVDDAAAFNTYLIQKDYDNAILPGVYDIPKDSTYEEIAALLTTKVE